MRMLPVALSLVMALTFFQSGAQGAASSNRLPQPPDKYCKFTERIRVLSPVSAGFYGYFTSNYFWSLDGVEGLYRSKPSDNYCEVSLASDIKGRTKLDSWVRIQGFTPAEEEWHAYDLGTRRTTVGRLYFEADWLHDGSITCVRESYEEKPEAFTQAEMLEHAGWMMECHDEPAINHKLDETLTECKILVNHFTVDRRVGRPLQPEKLKWMEKNLKSLNSELGAKCPTTFDVPSCNKARTVLSCLKELQGIAADLP